ncbi:MAG: glycosyltransferase family 2 protein [Nodosilinea sp.]
MYPAYEDSLVSIVLRTTKKRDVLFLNEAIRSIALNKYRPIEVVLVVQADDNIFIKKIKQLIDSYQDLKFSINLVVNPTDQDQRTRNLNLGIDRAKGRYLGFLDDDDIFYENHILDLIYPLSQSEHIAWSYGDVILVSCSMDDSNKIIRKTYGISYGKVFDLEDFFRGNFIPIHAYLIDRARVDSDLLKFDETFALAEDYAFLLRLAVNYQPCYVKELVSEYRIFKDLSNSTLIINDLFKIPDRSKIKAWSKALWQIEVLKERLLPAYTSGLFSQKLRKYFFYHFPDVKIFLQYKLPALRRFLIDIFHGLGFMD